MLRPRTRSALLLATAFTARATLAQEATDAAPATQESDEAVIAASELDVVLPGVTVTAGRDGNIQRAATEVVSILSDEDIARTGEGDIAGALSRVTGLSVVGGGFVYVRGLGDRYSQALLNGLPLPSPEPLRRAIPLDLFPTDVIASSLVQKTYSPNFPGEFGGGVINLTTLAVPKMPFLKFGAGLGGNTETTGHFGYDHFGSSTDWTGYAGSNRDLPPALRAFFASGDRMSSGSVNTGNIAKQFVNANNGVVQKVGSVPANWSASVSGGNSWPVGDALLGVIATAGFDNKWRTRDNIEQSPGNATLSVIDKDYRVVATENRAVANALLGVGVEFDGGSKLRWTNLYIHDTLKRTSLGAGKQNNQRLGVDFIEQNTGWYERELFSTQLAGGLQLETVSINGRAAYSTSSREAPSELGVGYSRSNQAASPFGAYFINRLDNGQTGFAQVAFSNLDEDQWSVGADVVWSILPGMNVSAGIDITNTERDSNRREFQVIAPSTFPSEIALLRPDYLVSAAVIDTYGIGLVETTETAPAFTAQLRTEAAFTQLQAEIFPGIDLGAGVRFERGLQEVGSLQVFRTASSVNAATKLENDYWLPAATLTWKFADAMQLRGNVSKTIARPQFRELMYQTYFDPESNRAYNGNPLMADSEFLNAELRYEWYFAPEQRVSVAGFYKGIDKPIEAFTSFNDNTPVTSFANAPKATLYGAEAEVQKYIPLIDWFDEGFFSLRRLVLIGNYTYTTSSIKVGNNDTVAVFGSAIQPATNYFRDGSQLTGQSDHLVNVQIGLEREHRLSQQTLLISYASDRVTSRGAAGGLPDIQESPGVTVDFVAREGFNLMDRELELKFEARNLLGRGYKEFQERNGNVIYYNKYDVGTSYSASISVNF